MAGFGKLILLILIAELIIAENSFHYGKSATRRSTSDCQTCCNDTCLHMDCLREASATVKNMDPEADPCTDFAEFACGNFYKTAIIPPGQPVTSVIYNIINQINDAMKEIIEEESEPGEWAYVKNMKNLYQSCMNKERVEQIGVQPYLNTSYAKEWPTLIGHHWPGESTFDLNDVMTKYFATGVTHIFSFSVKQDFKNTSKHTLNLNAPEFTLARSYLMKPRNDSVVMAYERYLRDLAIELGAGPTEAAQDAADVVDAEIKLAHISPSKEERRNDSNLYNPTTLAELGRNLSYIDIPRALRASFVTANITLEDDQEVNVAHSGYFNRLEGVVNSIGNRTLQNLFGFNYAISKVEDLTDRLQNIYFEYNKALYGAKTRMPLWLSCLWKIRSVFPYAISKQFVRRRFSEASKTKVLSMIANIKAEIEEMLQNATWIGNKTKAEALGKVKFYSICKTLRSAAPSEPSSPGVNSKSHHKHTPNIQPYTANMKT
ncbi:membrane metallo-endopeptidase-like 1 [Plakobranchus ocellatus]|uniref:Membrane metallo-endopeptidase-like 1 n=1 Tax=Plakobranchus ocellatus TaxID=259542 RepID=A0AAV4CHA9_9GAST|nr:membrane metallo-endopeptidase-like 1 [Plakobranchus ocellatus]